MYEDSGALVIAPTEEIVVADPKGPDAEVEEMFDVAPETTVCRGFVGVFGTLDEAKIVVGGVGDERGLSTLDV